MIYAAFTFWLFLSIFAAMGVYRLWTGLVPAAYVNWLMLPGTVVSEMAYIFGSLITGGEIRKAKIIDDSKAAAGAAAAPVTEATPRLKFIGPAVASLLAIVACGAAIVAADVYLGQPVIEPFTKAIQEPPSTELAIELTPANGQGYWQLCWDQAVQQIHLLQRTCETWGKLTWNDWHIPLFVYLAACLSIRLAPARRDVRAMLAAVLIVAGGIAIAGNVSPQFNSLMVTLWPLVTYVWASLLFLLAATLLIRGLHALLMILAGKQK